MIGGQSPNRLAFCGFAGLSLLILGPLLKPGFILTLDMVFTPILRMPDHINNSYPLYALLHFLNVLVPADIIQKLLLLTIFTLAGFGMHTLVWHISNEQGRAGQVGAFAAGLFYTVNPFTYARLMAGQYEILFGYALLPFFIAKLLGFLKKPSLRASLHLALLLTLIGIVSLHVLAITVLAVLITIIPYSIWNPMRQLVRPSLMSLATFLALSAYWLTPLILGKGSTADQLAQFSANDASAFATVGSNLLARVANVIRLEGFWLEPSGQYTLPQTGIPAWGVIGLIIWVLAVYGIIRLWKTQRQHIAMTVLGSMAVGVLLASGILGRLLAQVGFREPQKFTALIALSFAVGIGIAIPALLRIIRVQFNLTTAKLAAVVLLALPLIFTPTLLWGTRGQLHTSNYPYSWSQVNELLNADPSNFKTAFLPWHLYMKYGFSGRIIASPAPDFFDKPVLVSDNPERLGAGASQSTEAKKQLGKLLANAGSDNNLTNRLASLDIKYLLLVRENDYQNYGYLQRQPNLKRIFSSDSIEVYLNQTWKEK